MDAVDGFAPTGDAEVDAFVASDPFAFLVGLLLDQQVSIAWAFRGPATLRSRLGQLDPVRIAAMEPEDLVAVCVSKPAIHRYPAVMARRIHALAAHIVERHDGDPAVWEGARSGGGLTKRIGSLPGFGEEKTMITIAVLAKRFGIRPRGWRQAAGPFADAVPRSVADMGDAAGRQAVKDWKLAQRREGRSKRD